MQESRRPEREAKSPISDNEDSKCVEFDLPSKTWAGLKNQKWWPSCFQLIIISATAVSSTSGEPAQDLLICERWTPSVSNLLFWDVCVCVWVCKVGPALGLSVCWCAVQWDLFNPGQLREPPHLACCLQAVAKVSLAKRNFKSFFKKKMLIDVLLFHASDQWLSRMNNSRH